jgi:hypothetical protein
LRCRSSFPTIAATFCLCLSQESTAKCQEVADPVTQTGTAVTSAPQSRGASAWRASACATKATPVASAKLEVSAVTKRPACMVCKHGVEPKAATALLCSRTKLLHHALWLASVTGEDCTQAAGGALCRQDADCSQPGLPSLSGKCVGILGDNPGICSCNATYGCPSCNTHVAWLASGTS